MKAPMPLWWGSLTEYPDEGTIAVAAVDQQSALSIARKHLAGGGVEPEVSVRPITEQDVDLLQEEIETLRRDLAAARTAANSEAA